MRVLKVAPGSSRYNIYTGPGILKEIARHLKQSRTGKRLFLATNPGIFELYGFKLKEELLAAGFEVLSKGRR